MGIFEPIRRGLPGFGADADVLGMLEQGGPEPACWEIHSLDDGPLAIIAVPFTIAVVTAAYFVSGGTA